MQKIIVYALSVLIFAVACATVSNKWTEAGLESVSEQCKQEYLSMKPSTSRWYNLKTQERNKKKKELEEYKKKQLDLYRAMYNYIRIYSSGVGADGMCRGGECATLAKLRAQIIEACPVAGEQFPDVTIK